MKFLEFKLPKEIKDLLGDKHGISSIITDENGFRIAFYRYENYDYEVVFDFEFSVMDYRVSDEGRRLDYHTSNRLNKAVFEEVKDSEYLEKLNKESQGVLLAVDPDLKHYITGDEDYCVDIISRVEPKVYKVKSKK